MKSPKQIALAIKSFVDTCYEWHALVIGFCEVLCPWPPHIKPLASYTHSALDYVQEEYHYYMFGRALGVMAWIGIAKLIQGIFF